MNVVVQVVLACWSGAWCLVLLLYVASMAKTSFGFEEQQTCAIRC
jgi:hypothetical protein